MKSAAIAVVLALTSCLLVTVPAAATTYCVGHVIQLEGKADDSMVVVLAPEGTCDCNYAQGSNRVFQQADAAKNHAKA